MLEETTAMCRFGSPPGSALSELMNAGKAAMSFCCSGCMLDELSIMNRRSRSREVGGVNS